VIYQVEKGVALWCEKDKGHPYLIKISCDIQ